MMDFKRHNRIFLILLSALFVLAVAQKTTAEPTKANVYKIKAAFLYNFIKFVDWPEDKIADSNDVITIGIIGNDPFEDAFEPIKAKKVKDKTLVIKHFPSIITYKARYKKDEYKADYGDAFKKCHLLFISSSEKEHIEEIINLVEGGSVLTVGETAGFIEAGGIINFVMEQKKVRFEINNAAAKQAELKMRSQLLRLAKKVIDEKTPKDAEK